MKFFRRRANGKASETLPSKYLNSVMNLLTCFLRAPKVRNFRKSSVVLALIVSANPSHAQPTVNSDALRSAINSAILEFVFLNYDFETNPDLNVNDIAASVEEVFSPPQFTPDIAELIRKSRTSSGSCRDLSKDLVHDRFSRDRSRRIDWCSSPVADHVRRSIYKIDGNGNYGFSRYVDYHCDFVLLPTQIDRRALNCR